MKTTYSMDRNRVYLPPPLRWLGWWVESGKEEEEAAAASAKVRGGGFAPCQTTPKNTTRKVPILS